MAMVALVTMVVLDTITSILVFFDSICICTLLLYSSLKRLLNSVLRDVHIMETVV